MEISVLTFEKICRICLIESADMKSLFSKVDGEDRSLLEILKFTANINITFEDDLPKQVCDECQSVMYKAEAFKRRCLESEKTLYSIYQNAQGKVKTSNIDKCIKDKKCYIKRKLSSCDSLDPSNVANQASKDSFVKNTGLQEASIYSTADTSSCELANSKVTTNNELPVKEEMIDNFEVEQEFPDHYNSEAECETTPIDIKNENAIENETKTYSCFCGLTFTNQNECNTHLKLENCNKYKKIIAKINKNKLMNIKNQIECVDCNCKFDTPNAWRMHQLTHRNKSLSNNKTELYECKFCLCKFKNATALSSHRHETTTKSETEFYQCTFCLRKFKNKKSLSAHMQRHQERDNIKHVCQICKRDFKYKAYLENHILTMHSKKNGLCCDVCAQSFPNDKSLELHKKSHKNKKKHCCTVCNKSFVMGCTLKEHMRTHTGEKPFLCSQCGRGFSQKTNLAQHMRRHQGLKPFKCEICEKRFVSKGELDAHTRKHSGAHPFVCDDCGNSFTTSSALVKHRRIHTGEKPYLCDLCPMRFAASGTLKNHRRIHTGERPFQCSYCEKAFVQRNDLISHIRCHTGEKPYVCNQCGQSFRRATGLKTHVKMHMKEPGNMLQGVNMMLNGMQCAEQ